jgi:hypothetical protein
VWSQVGTRRPPRFCIRGQNRCCSESKHRSGALPASRFPAPSIRDSAPFVDRIDAERGGAANLGATRSRPRPLLHSKDPVQEGIRSASALDYRLWGIRC